MCSALLMVNIWTCPYVYSCHESLPNSALNTGFSSGDLNFQEPREIHAEYAPIKPHPVIATCSPRPQINSLLLWLHTTRQRTNHVASRLDINNCKSTPNSARSPTSRSDRHEAFPLFGPWSCRRLKATAGRRYAVTQKQTCLCLNFRVSTLDPLYPWERDGA
jgi:hypothetical protein